MTYHSMEYKRTFNDHDAFKSTFIFQEEKRVNGENTCLHCYNVKENPPFGYLSPPDLLRPESIRVPLKFEIHIHFAIGKSKRPTTHPHLN